MDRETFRRCKADIGNPAHRFGVAVMSSLDELRWMFFLECAELLEALDDGFDRLTSADLTTEADQEEINSVFRAVHSIKGGAASFGLDDLVRFAHGFETVLDEMRSGRLMPTDADWRTLRRAGDTLANLVAAARDGLTADAAHAAEVAGALAALVAPAADADKSASMGSGPSLEPAPLTIDPPALPETGFAPLTLSFHEDSDPAPGAIEDIQVLGDAGQSSRIFRISFATTPALFANGHDPVHLFRELGEMGTLQVEAVFADLPIDPDPSQCYLSWRLTLETEYSEADIREVFEFVESLAEIAISDKPLPPAGNTPNVPEGATSPLKPPLTDTASGAAKIPDAAELAPLPDPPKDPDRQYPSPAPVSAAPVSAPPAAAAASRKSTVRVDLGLVDDLINIVGELVINQSFLSQSIADAGLSNQTQLSAGLDEFKSLARQIQEGVMAIRAQSVKPLFQRMARIVREASAVAGKPVRFETSGEATEVDTTVIERLIDPLTHILRNAVDHGLEKPDIRSQSGKSEEGLVRLSAEHRSGRVLIEVSDDGGGINRAKVLAIAKQKGLLPPDANPQEAEIDRMLFQPGFSTAELVTDLSGRGVGMDVVRSAIQKLGGRTNISSLPGRGTTISISLPLTLAVLEGMVVKVMGQTMVIPITAIIETLRPEADEIEHLAQGAEVVRVRDRMVPIVNLGTVFGYPHGSREADDRVLLLVEAEQGRQWALSVDEIRDQRQVVIKSLEENYGRVPGVAAATILGDGRIALIIDPEETIRTATMRDRARSGPPPLPEPTAPPQPVGA
ncbi:chemotaxis protein CheA [Roseivivax sp. CAU 1753]